MLTLTWGFVAERGFMKLGVRLGSGAQSARQSLAVKKGQRSWASPTAGRHQQVVAVCHAPPYIRAPHLVVVAQRGYGAHRRLGHHHEAAAGELEAVHVGPRHLQHVLYLPAAQG